MLKEMLRLASGKGTERMSELARKLNISQALAEDMLENLASQGYLHAVVQGCSSPCEKCPVNTACLFDNHPRIWVLTKKGESVVGARDG